MISKGPQVSHGGLLSALRWKHKVEGVPFPVDDNGVLAALARRGRRLGPKKQVAEALHPSTVKQWLEKQKINLAQPWLRMIMCLLTLGLRMGLRPSEVEHLSVGDVKCEGGIISVRIRDGKTDHIDRVMPTTYIEPSRGAGFCCPFVWTMLWMQERAGSSSGSPLFTHDGTRTGYRLSRSSVGEIVQAVSSRAQDGWLYSGKSLRRGMATIMAAAGLSTQQIMAMGRWKSHDMPARYTAEWAPALAEASTIIDLSAYGAQSTSTWGPESSKHGAWSRLCAAGVLSQRHLIDEDQLVRQSRVQKSSFLQGKNNFSETRTCNRTVAYRFR